MTESHSRILEGAHDLGLSPGTENTNGNENMNEDEEINQFERGRMKLALKDQLIKRRTDELRPRPRLTRSASGHGSVCGIDTA